MQQGEDSRHALSAWHQIKAQGSVCFIVYIKIKEFCTHKTVVHSFDQGTFAHFCVFIIIQAKFYSYDVLHMNIMLYLRPKSYTIP